MPIVEYRKEMIIMGAGVEKFMKNTLIHAMENAAEGAAAAAPKIELEANKAINMLKPSISSSDLMHGAKQAAEERIRGSELAKKFTEKEGGGYSKADIAKSMFYHQNGDFAYKRTAGAIAGSYLGVSSLGRVATGGGLYKDSDGNTDLIGIPFI